MMDALTVFFKSGPTFKSGFFSKCRQGAEIIHSFAVRIKKVRALRVARTKQGVERKGGFSCRFYSLANDMPEGL